MANIDLHKEYNSSGESVQDLFDSTEEGFFVPLYQREYTWEEDNITQLFDDLISGTRALSDDTNATTFLGTTILTALSNKTQTVKDHEVRAQPTGVQIVIDGQQRISTLALLSIQITVKLRALLQHLPDQRPYVDLKNAGDESEKRLNRLYTIEIGKGANPTLKPKIIRAREDRWTYDGSDNAYGSPVAHYIATFIRTANPETALASIDANAGTRVRGNIILMGKLLQGVCDAHIPHTSMYDQFPVGPRITVSQMQDYVLGFFDEDVRAVVDIAETDKLNRDYYASAVYQLLLFAYYLLRRCGVNRLQPMHEEWGFDMFQALNATGTPLTVLETFLPQVMQAERAEQNEWDRTPSRESMNEIQELFDVTTTNEQKNLRTNELLGAFALCYTGEKIGNKFSDQRKWLTQVYQERLPEIEGKRELIERLARTANFFYFAWYLEESAVANRINGLEQHAEGELASLLVRYLKDASSRLSAPILARFYSQARSGQSTFCEFVESAKACAAFFTLWRSANSTSGLDSIYRRYFGGSEAPVKVHEHNWKAVPGPVTSNSLKRYFRDVLSNRGISDRNDWITASSRFLLYTELKTVCRFVLFVASHDRVADSANPGLTNPGTTGSCTLLKLDRWTARAHKTLEHVCPQSPPSDHTWDRAIYTGGLVNQVGNLMLLPLELNEYVENKDWSVKYLYYCHVGERDRTKLAEISAAAGRRGIVLKKRATNALTKAEYNCAVEPILSVGATGLWDASLVERRTRQIKELAWDILNSWLEPR